MSSGVTLYSIGLVHASACAPAELTGDQVAAAANASAPTGISSPWAISDEPTFQHGEPNPCPCNDHPDDRRHWLLVC